MRDIEILWHSDELRSSEHCTLVSTSAGWQLDGVVVLPIDDVPSHIHYTVVAGPEWNSQSADVAVHGPQARSIEIRHLDSTWSVDGRHRPDLDSCSDIDLGWTPATNMVPIRRLALDIGETATTTAVWVRFPEMTIEPSQQRYTRTADREWRYEAGAYVAAITVDEHGLVTRYGTDLWRAVACT